MDSLFSFKLLFSWFLVWWMSLDSCTLNILVIMLGDLRSLKFSFQQAVTLFRLGMHALAKFCGLWFQCHSDFQSLYAVILLCLIYLLPPGLPLVSAGSLWKGRIFPRLHHLVNLNWERIFSRDEEHFQDGCLGDKLPLPVGGAKCVLYHVIVVAGSFARGPLASWYLCGRQGTLRSCAEDFLKAWYCSHGVIPFVSAPGCVLSLGGVKTLRPDASVNFSSFLVAFPHVLCVQEEAGPMPLSEGSGYLSICFSRGCPHERCRLVSKSAWTYWPWEGSGWGDPLGF